MPLGAFFLSLVQPLIARILVTLGFAVVTFTGMSAVITNLTDRLVAAWGGLPAGVLQLAGLAGVGEGLSIVCGAVATRLAIWQLTKSTRMLANNPG